MEHFLNNDEERLLELLEQKAPQELSAEEKAFVEQHMSLAEYALQHRMIAEAADLYDTAPEAKPLLVPAATMTERSRRTVPLYQAIAAVAATIALFLSIWPAQQAQPKGTEKGPQLTQTDTVIRTEIIIDTVIRYVERRAKYAATATAVTPDNAVIRANDLRILEAGPVSLPEITEELIRTKGSSMRDDSATRTILNGMYQSAIW